MNIETTLPRESGGIQYGAVALIDLLGFKESPKTDEEKLQAVKNIRNYVIDQHKGMTDIDTIFDRVERPNRCFEFLSDTFCIGVPLVDRQGMVQLGYLIAHLHAAAVHEGFPIRGVISCGNFVFEDSIVLGSGVFEAARYMEQSLEACVWLLQSAIE